MRTIMLHLCRRKNVQIETFAERYKSCNIVIPAEAGIQCFHGLSGFRINPSIMLRVVSMSNESGITEKGDIAK